MFDAVVFAKADAKAAARTLASLVEGAVEGSLGRVTLISATRDAAIEALAEASGCGLAAGVAPEALAATLAERIATPHALAAEAGALMLPGWPAALDAELRREGGLSPDMALLFRPESTADWLKLVFAVSVKGRMPLDHGALVPRRRLIDPRYRGGPVKSFGPMHMSAMRVGRVPSPA